MSRYRGEYEHCIDIRNRRNVYGDFWRWPERPRENNDVPRGVQSIRTPYGGTGIYVTPTQSRDRRQDNKLSAPGVGSGVFELTLGSAFLLVYVEIIPGRLISGNSKALLEGGGRHSS